MTMTTTEARRLAERIVADLFRNGAGQEAERLVLVDAAGRDLGGWGRRPVVDRVADVLLAESEEPR